MPTECVLVPVSEVKRGDRHVDAEQHTIWTALRNAVVTRHMVRIRVKNGGFSTSLADAYTMEWEAENPEILIVRNRK